MRGEVPATDAPATDAPGAPEGTSGASVRRGRDALDGPSADPGGGARTLAPISTTPPPVAVGRGLVAAALPLVAGAALVASGLPLCPTKALFGVPCPGCGLTRATICLLHLDLPGVWRFHPLALVVSPLVGWWLASVALGAARVPWATRVDPGRLVPSWVWAGLAVLMVALYVARLGGLLGGLPDPVDPRAGWLGRAALAAFELARGVR